MHDCDQRRRTFLLTATGSAVAVAAIILCSCEQTAFAQAIDSHSAHDPVHGWTAHNHGHEHAHGADGASSAPGATSTTASAASIGLLAIYSVLIIAASMVGGMLPSLVRLTHVRMQVLISGVGGLMLGIAVFHLMPHAAAELGPARVDLMSGWLMAGLLIMFFMLRAFHFHQHDVTPLDDAAGAATGHVHDSDCGHDHDHSGHAHDHPGDHAHRLSWIGVFAGLSLHTLIDGAALGASVAAEAAGTDAWRLFGLGTFAAVFLHKPLDALSITSLMRAGGWSSKTVLLVNAAFAAMCPLGAALFIFGVNQWAEGSTVVIGCALAFAAGVFLCISLGDLLPEMEFHSHHRLRLTLALLLGVALAWGIGFLEPAHLHEHGVGGSPASHAH